MKLDLSVHIPYIDLANRSAILEQNASKFIDKTYDMFHSGERKFYAKNFLIYNGSQVSNVLNCVRLGLH